MRGASATATKCRDVQSDALASNLRGSTSTGDTQDVGSKANNPSQIDSHTSHAQAGQVKDEEKTWFKKPFASHAGTEASR
jgi:hypothetical protein